MFQFLIEEYLPGYNLPKRRIATDNLFLDVETSTLSVLDNGGCPYIPGWIRQTPGVIAVRKSDDGGGSLLVLLDSRKEYRFLYIKVTNENLADFYPYLD